MMAPLTLITMDTTMAKYILTILRSEPMVVFSWGFCSATALENGLQFHVSGYKHQGKVNVVYNAGTNLFDVILLNREGEEIRKEGDVYLDNLVSVIDGMVERTSDYSSRVRKQYGL